jgi:hypothetical protein
MTCSSAINSAMFHELSARVEKLVCSIRWSRVEDDHSIGVVNHGEANMHCFLQTYDQPGHEGLLFGTHILPFPLPPETAALTARFMEETTDCLLLPKMGAMITADERWRAVTFKNILLPRQTGYTDAKLTAMCEMNLILGKAAARCMVGLHQHSMSLESAAIEFCKAFDAAIRAKGEMLF